MRLPRYEADVSATLPCTFGPYLRTATATVTTTATTTILVAKSPPSQLLTASTPCSKPQMGNLCGKESKDNFEGQGRTLGSAPAPATRAPVPKNVTAPKPKVGGPPRTLGESNRENDPKAAAAAAAEVRSEGPLLESKTRQTTAQVVTMVADMFARHARTRLPPATSRRSSMRRSAKRIPRRYSKLPTRTVEHEKPTKRPRRETTTEVDARKDQGHCTYPCAYSFTIHDTDILPKWWFGALHHA
jgi:hypothetical protein